MKNQNRCKVVVYFKIKFWKCITPKRKESKIGVFNPKKKEGLKQIRNKKWIKQYILFSTILSSPPLVTTPPIFDPPLLPALAGAGGAAAVNGGDLVRLGRGGARTELGERIRERSEDLVGKLLNRNRFVILNRFVKNGLKLDSKLFALHQLH